jgi:type II secretory pathway component PulC
MNKKTIIIDKLKNLIARAIAKGEALTNKRFLIKVLAIFLFLFLIFFIYHLYSITVLKEQRIKQKEQRVKQLEQTVKQLEQELHFLQALPTPELPADELFIPGVVGEEVPVPVNELGAILFDTIGVIQEIQQDRIIVMGDGTNFADQKPRQLSLLFTLETNVFLADRKHYVGLAGLEQLQPGIQILIRGAENIRGKIEFRVLNINVLEI